MSKCEITETNRGKPCALYNGHQYRIHRKNRNGTISWLCRKEKGTLCKGRILTSEDYTVLKEISHICEADVAATEVQKRLCSAKKRARTENTPVSKIYKEEFSEIMDGGYNFVTKIPEYSTAKYTLLLNRRKEKGIQRDPKTADEIVLTKEMLELPGSKENFLLADSKCNERIIIFASQKGKEALIENLTCFMDGTFKSCPKQFKQIFTIHVDLGSNNSITNVIPVIYAFLPNKKKETYERFFLLVKEAIPTWTPEIINADFEEASIMAIRKVFPDVKIHGCNFHFNQCLWRKVQDLGLVRYYKEDEEIRLCIRMCASLAFLPIEDVDEGWLCIQQNSPDNSLLQSFYDYFVETWLDHRFFEKEMWNCHNIRHRTNNPVEGWNYKLNSMVEKHHPSFGNIITVLKHEVIYNDFLYNRSILNFDRRKRKRKYIKLDEQISNILAAYTVSAKNYESIKICLEKLSHIHKLS